MLRCADAEEADLTRRECQQSLTGPGLRRASACSPKSDLLRLATRLSPNQLCTTHILSEYGRLP